MELETVRMLRMVVQNGTGERKARAEREHQAPGYIGIEVDDN